MLPPLPFSLCIDDIPLEQNIKKANLNKTEVQYAVNWALTSLLTTHN